MSLQSRDGKLEMTWWRKHVGDDVFKIVVVARELSWHMKNLVKWRMKCHVKWCKEMMFERHN